MIDYKKAGVDIKAGDEASKIAYNLAKSTFNSRRGMLGEPVVEDGSFAGLIDMGSFFLVQCDDGVGTKIEIAEEIGKFDTLGFDLLAMVADDAVCLGAETISVTNTLDTRKVEAWIVKELLSGLSEACQQQRVVIPGGEIAEVGKSVSGNVWNATAVGVLEKHKVINTRDIKVGDKIIGLKESGFRSNGFSLVRYIMENQLGKNCYLLESPFGKTWGEALLEPSLIYSSAILELIGRFGEERKVNIKGIAHITGGGIPGNFFRILKRTGFGACFDHLYEPSEMVKTIQMMGNVAEDEAYRTWNMGNGMMLVTEPKDVEKVLNLITLEAQVVGEIVDDKKVTIHSCGVYPQKLYFTE